MEVDRAGAAVSGCVLASLAEDATALVVSSRDPSSLADDATSLLNVLLLSVDLSSSDTLVVRTVAAADSRTLLVSCVTGLSAVPAAVAAVALVRASLLIESLLRDVGVLGVTVDLASLSSLPDRLFCPLFLLNVSRDVLAV